MLARRVVITGIGTINPIGNTVDEFWQNLEAGRSGVRLCQNVDLSDYHVKIAAEVDLPDISEYFSSRKMVKRLDRNIIFGFVAGCQAVDDSGIDISASPERYGVIIGSGDGGVITHFQTVSRVNRLGIGAVSPFYVPNVIPNSASAFLAQEKQLKGPSFAVSSACASANHALGVAALMIQSGMADAIYAGGTEAVIVEPSIGGFGNIMALSPQTNNPQAASRPFDKDRNGFVIGEGAGVLCVEELEHAQARGAHIYCELSGFGFTSDAYDLVAPNPTGESAAQAMRIAMRAAQIGPQDLSFINAHGTSTPMGDRVESVAINVALGADWGPKVRVNSTKSMTGHLIGAASAVEAIACIMAFKRGIIHKTINLENQDPLINLNVIKETVYEKDVEHVLSNAFGFGGHNAVTVFSRFRD